MNLGGTGLGYRVLSTKFRLFVILNDEKAVKLNSAPKFEIMKTDLPA